MRKGSLTRSLLLVVLVPILLLGTGSGRAITARYLGAWS